MSTIHFLSQRFGPADHGRQLQQMFRNEDVSEILVAVAFATSSGVRELIDSIPQGKDPVVYLGIRNGITSVQAIFAFLRAGIVPYVVDTSNQSVIFHPKIYVAKSDNVASVITGSANLTDGGLHTNIEASFLIELDLQYEHDRGVWSIISDTYSKLPRLYPDHVFRVGNSRNAVSLLREGRLIDEREARVIVKGSLRSSSTRDVLPTIPLRPVKGHRNRKKPSRKNMLISRGKHVLMWVSNPLTNRSLNISEHAGTNPTGDTNLGRGQMDDIEFQTYFRHEVFSELDWVTDEDSGNPYLERAFADFELVIKGVSHGSFRLEITHDPRTDTRSFLQRNAMTKLKWGEAVGLISDPDLLNREMSLFDLGNSRFAIEID